MCPMVRNERKSVMARRRKIKRKNPGANLGILLVLMFIGAFVFSRSKSLMGSENLGSGQVEAARSETQDIVETPSQNEGKSPHWKNGVFNPPAKSGDSEPYMKDWEIVEGKIIPKGSTLEKEKALKPWEVTY
ncbi:hypothetical protein HN418_02765 [archaeon]|nr:hypothetical protein [archaeon]